MPLIGDGEDSARRLVEAVEALRVDDEGVGMKRRALAFLAASDEDFPLEAFEAEAGNIARLVHRYTDTRETNLFPSARSLNGGGETTLLRAISDSIVLGIARRRVPWHDRNALIFILQTELPKMGFWRLSPQELFGMSTENLGTAVLIVRMFQSEDWRIRSLSRSILEDMRTNFSEDFFDPANKLIREAIEDTIIFLDHSTSSLAILNPHFLEGLEEIYLHFGNRTFPLEELQADFPAYDFTLINTAIILGLIAEVPDGGLKILPEINVGRVQRSGQGASLALIEEATDREVDRILHGSAPPPLGGSVDQRLSH